MTNQIGSGTRNLTYNVPTDERAELGRLAFQAGAKSIGDYVRFLTLKGLEQTDPEAAARLRSIRKQYYGSVLLAGIFVFSLVINPQQDLRRARRTRVEEMREELEAA